LPDKIGSSYVFLSASRLRNTNQQFAGRSANLRMNQGHQSVPKDT
jgi:hypothetical protein